MSSVLQRLRPKTFVFSLLAACIPAFLLEPVAERALFESAESAHNSVFDIHNLYKKRVTAGWRGEPTPNYTTIVEIRSGREPAWISLTNVCTQRLFLSYLIRKVDRARPQVIVIDKYFSATACPVEDTGTKELLAAIREVSSTTPTVIAAIDEPIDRDSHRHNRYSLTTGLLFTGNKVQYGDLQLAPDKRRIPLLWHLFRGKDDTKGYYLKSLALQAALLREPDLIKNHPALGRLVTHRRFPYTSFITAVPIDVVPAGAFVFGSGAFPTRETWARTISLQPDQNFLDRLRGRIVFIGENHPHMDQWNTEIGSVPGVVLHANYVESLLDQRYFEPVAWYWNIVAGLIIFFCFHASLVLAEELVAHWRLHPIIHFLLALISAACVIAVSFLALAIFVVFFGIYIDPLNLSLTAMWVSVLHVFFYNVKISDAALKPRQVLPGGPTNVQQPAPADSQIDHTGVTHRSLRHLGWVLPGWG